MKNFYVISFSNFYIHYNGKLFFANSNAYCKITDATSNDILLVTSIQHSKNYLEIPLYNLQQSNFYRFSEIGNSVFIELLVDNFNSLCCKFNLKNIEVYIYQSAVRILKDNVCYCYFFNAEHQNFTFLDSEKLYIYNNINVLVFDIKNLTYDYYIVEKLEKNNEKIEILCKIPKNYGYFLHFLMNVSNNTIQIKRYKKQHFENSKTEPMSFFYLVKNQINDAENMINSAKINIENLTDYFKKYDNIFEVEENYYLCNSSEVVPINFKIENNKIIDID